MCTYTNIHMRITPPEKLSQRHDAASAALAAQIAVNTTLAGSCGGLVVLPDGRLSHTFRCTGFSFEFVRINRAAEDL